MSPLVVSHLWSIEVRVMHVILTVKLIKAIPRIAIRTVFTIRIWLIVAFMMEVSHLMWTVVLLHNIVQSLCMPVAEVVVVLLILVMGVEISLLEVQESMVSVMDRVVLVVLLTVLSRVHVVEGWFESMVWGIMHSMIEAVIGIRKVGLLCEAVVAIWLLPVVSVVALVPVYVWVKVLAQQIRGQGVMRVVEV